MKNSGFHIALTTIILSLLFLSSCDKYPAPPMAVLLLKFDGQNEAVEWMEVSGTRDRNSGQVSLTAVGYEDEIFRLDIPGVFGLGAIPNLTEKNLSFTNTYGFVTDTLRSVELIIADINDFRIFGRFSVSFADRRLSKLISAHGEFSILGQQ